MRIALGMITKDLLTTEPVKAFVDNARKFNHELDSIIIAYADQLDQKVVSEMSQWIKVHLVKIRQDTGLEKALLDLGMNQRDCRHLIGRTHEKFDGRAPYGENRNHVIIKALLEGIDVLFFLDTDVYPEVVIKSENLILDPKYDKRPSGIEGVWIQEVDFVGEHLKHLSEPNVMLTTSDYTGYYIIPPMAFDGMDDLFYGVKKEGAYTYIMDSFKHHCLATDQGLKRQKIPTNKVLGGNVCMDLNLFKRIVPFFSSVYYVQNQKYLTRGEDTVLALQAMDEDDLIFMDIDMKIFHNTYGHFPTVPDILKDEKIKNRFFSAAMGWIGRNPFLNHIQGLDTNLCYEKEHEHLLRGAVAVSEHLKEKVT